MLSEDWYSSDHTDKYTDFFLKYKHICQRNILFIASHWLVSSSAGISKDTHVFSSTQDSEDHVSGWHAINGVAKEAGVKQSSKILKGEYLTTDKNDHTQEVTNFVAT